MALEARLLHAPHMDRPDVRLRPFQESDLALWDRFATDPSVAGEFEWRGFGDPMKQRRRWQEDGFLGRDPRYLAVCVEEEVAGLAMWLARPRPDAGVLEVGVVIAPEHRGKGVGTSAQRLLVQYLLATTPVHRLEATTEVDNVAEHKALERCGFVHEGVLREATFREGAWRDVAMYSRLRS